ncbi:hypothetical protein FB45DRAFT_368132, partial [Roridomyces roridus]
MAEQVILTNFRVAWDILGRKVHRALPDDGCLMGQLRWEVQRFLYSVQRNRSVFSEEEFSGLEQEISDMIQSLVKATRATSPLNSSPTNTPREMHRALLIPEIVQSIILQLAHEIFRTEGALACLARTCTLFSEHALDFLWRDLRELQYLIMCMPQDVWATHKSGPETIFTIRRPIVDTDWERVSYYSHRVRHLRYLASNKDSRHNICAALLETTIPGGYLLPNLVSLWDCRLESPRDLDLFLSSRLAHLRWSIHDETLLPVFTERFPALQRVHLDGRYSGAE